MQALFQPYQLSTITYLQLWIAVLTYFLFLYFILGTAFRWTVDKLNQKQLLSKISLEAITKAQIYYEIRHSLLSIILFAFSALPLLYMYKEGFIQFQESTLLNTLGGLFLLVTWNEVHFYVVHRFMHTAWLMKRVHYIHHRSKTPTVYSVFSFHPLEAFLLSTVPLFILPILNLSLLSVILFPLVSILLNFAGHCNYRWGNGQGASWTLFGTRHQHHHSAALKQYGFASGLLDKIFTRH